MKGIQNLLVEGLRVLVQLYIGDLIGLPINIIRLMPHIHYLQEL
jgi:hypothetical protein